MSTAIVTSDTSEEHITGDGHPEQPKRVSAVINRLKKRVKFDNGKAIEMFRYYKGIPDGMGRKKRY